MAVLLITTACGSFLFRSGDEEIVSGVDLIRQLRADINNEVSIGEVAEIRDLKVSVTAVRLTDGRNERISAPPPSVGQIYLLAEVLMENVGSKQALISSRMQISLVDSDGETQDWAFFPTLKGSIDGRIDPGRERMGELAWVVDDDADGLMMVFGGTAFVLGDVSGNRSGSPETQLVSMRQ
ncbi:MAG: DUF4352 domain-containing protein [Chloroflexi bacterium]|nr:DUF4352 domain-containing protein [Chloroflexota bacterium]